MIKDKKHLENIRKTHKIIEETLDLNGIQGKEAADALVYTLMIIVGAHKIPIEDVDRMANFLKKWHRDSMEAIGLK